MTKSVSSYHTGHKTMYGKKVLSVLLTVMMLIGCFGSAFSAFAEGTVIANGQCGNDVFWKITEDGDDKIFTVYPGNDPDKNKKMWVRTSWLGDDFDAYDITGIVIEDGVTSIGSAAFGFGEGITNLELLGEKSRIGGCTQNQFGDYYPKNFMNAVATLIIPNSVTSIGSYAFYHCSGLTGSLTIPDSVTTIGDNAFDNCSGFTGLLTLPDSMTSIGQSAFRDCSGFTGALTIPDSVTTIDYYTFSGCSGFTGSLTIPDSVTSIGPSAFSGCSGFTGSLTIPNSVTSIGSSVFSNCSGFNGTLTISESVTSIEDDTFYNCSGFTGSLVIPDSVLSINDEAFFGCSGFNGTLTLGDFVERIGQNAFYNCSGFTGTLLIPDSVLEISVPNSYIGNSYGAFNNCTGFDKLILGCNVTNIGYGAFWRCSGFIGTLTIPDSVTSIGSYAFSGCSGFTGSLTIPDSVTSIGGSAFYGCSGFDGTLTISESVTSIENSSFDSCSGFIGSLIIPDSVTSIKSSAFENCSGFNGELKLGNAPETSQLQEIAQHAFGHCSNLSGQLLLPNNLTIEDVGEDAFHGCAEDANIIEFFTNYPDYIRLEKQSTTNPTPEHDGFTTYKVYCNDSKAGNHTYGNYSALLTSIDMDEVPYLSVETITPNVSSMELKWDETQTITATVSPADATDPTLKFTSSDPSIVTVDENTGEVKAVDIGTATITIAAADGTGTPATVTVTVKDPEIIASPDKILLQPYCSQSISFSTDPSAYRWNKVNSVTYESSNPDIASVDSNGYVTNNGSIGSANITITVNGLYSTTVPVSVYSYNLYYPNNTIGIGNTESLFFECSDENAVIKSVTASNYDPSIISIDENGNITGLASGNTCPNIEVVCEIYGVEKTFSLSPWIDVTKLVSDITITDNNGNDINGQTITLNKGNADWYFKVQVNPSDASNKNLNWNYDSNVAYVGNTWSSDGNYNPYVQAYNPGTMTVTVSTTDGSNISKSFTVNVIAPVQDVTVSTPFNGVNMLAVDPEVYPNAYYLADSNGDPLQFDSNPLDPTKTYVFDVDGDAIKFEPYVGTLDSSATGGYNFDPLFVYYMDGSIAVLGYHNRNVIAYMPFEMPDEKMSLPVNASMEFTGTQNSIVNLAPVTVFDSDNNFGLILDGTFDSNPIVDGQKYELIYSMEEKEVREKQLVFDPNVLPDAYYLTNTDGSVWSYDKFDDDSKYIIKTESGKTYEFYPCDTPDSSLTNGYEFQSDVFVCNTDDGDLYMGYCNGKAIIPITFGAIPAERTEENIEFIEMDIYASVIYEKLVGIGMSDPLPESELENMGIHVEYPYLMLYIQDGDELEEMGYILYSDGKLIFPMEDDGMTDANFSLSLTSVEPVAITLTVGDTLDIRTAVQPYNAQYSDLNVSIEDSTVASYENNTLTGLTAGTTKMIVTLTNADGEPYTKKFDVVVNEDYILHERVEPTDGHDGNKEYYEKDGQIYEKDQNGDYVLSDLESVTLHYPNEPVVENEKHENGEYCFDLVTYCDNEDHDNPVEMDRETVVLTKHDAVPATANENGNVEYYEDGDGNKYVYDGEHYVPVDDTAIVTSITMTPVAAKDATDGEDGNDAYYEGSDGKVYVKDDEDKFVETTLEDVTRHFAGEPVIENQINDPASDTPYQFDLVTYCKNDGTEMDRETVVLTKYDAVPATANENGNVEYYEDGDGNKYVYDGEHYVPVDDTSIVTSITMTPVAAKDATDGKDGNDAYYEGSDGKVYVKDDEGKFVETTLEDVARHFAGEPVIENPINDPASDTPYQFDLVTYCKNDGTEMDRETVVLTKYDAVPATVNRTGNVEYFKGTDGKNYVWDNDAEKYVETDNVTLPKVAVKPVAGYPATETKDGLKDHFKDEDGNLYVFDGNKYVSVTEDDLVIHMTATRHENEVAPTCTSNGSYDKITYCVNCGKIIYSEHVVISGGHKDSNNDGYCDNCGGEIGWHCSKCDWYNENKDKPGAFGIVVKIIHVIVHFIESINRLT